MKRRFKNPRGQAGLFSRRRLRSPKIKALPCAGFLRSHHISLARKLAAFLVPALLAASLSNAHAQEVTMAVFAPSIDFGDSIGMAGYGERLAGQVASKSGVRVRVLALARAGDLQARARSGSIDYAVVGGAYASVAGLGKPIAHAVGAVRIVVAAKPGTGSTPAALRGKTLILPQPATAYERFVSASLLAHEVSAKDFFVLKTTKNVSSALAAVRLGQADLTVCLVPYATSAGLTILARRKAGPLPVVIQINRELDPVMAQKLATGFRAASVSGGKGVLRGFGGSGQGIRGFRSLARSGPSRKAPRMAPHRPLRLRFDVPASRDPNLVRTSVQDLIPTPELEAEVD